MLLPSALSCGSAQPPRRLQLQPSLFTSPPASPPTLSSQDAFGGNIMNSCLSLQSLIAAPTSTASTASDQLPPQTFDQLPTPPLTHAYPPLKLRLRRPRGRPDSANKDKPRRVVKRESASRGLNKRRRCPQDNAGRDDSDAQDSETSDLELDSAASPEIPSTPPRSRIAPEQLPLGLERADFHDAYIHDPDRTLEQDKPGTNAELEADGELWSAEQNAMFTETVLEKLKHKLSKAEWQEIALIMGRDGRNISRHWETLIDRGAVGFKGRSQKPYLTW